MPLFMIVPQPNPAGHKLGHAIHEAFPSSYLDLENGAGWLVVAPGSPEQISRKAGITDGENGAAVVVQVATYFGFANANIWAWIQANWGRA